MAFEQRDNSGSLFKNDKKDGDKHPDRKGSAMIGGVHYWVSGWVKQDRNGNPWMSLSFQPKEQATRSQEQIKPVKTPLRADLDDSEIPF